jgi:hypothetical protein
MFIHESGSSPDTQPSAPAFFYIDVTSEDFTATVNSHGDKSVKDTVGLRSGGSPALAAAPVDVAFDCGLI